MKVILSIDGGGTRGLIQAMILHKIEITLREVLNDKTAHLIDYVDIVSGTSTGGIEAIILTVPLGNEYRYDTANLVNFYNTHCKVIFNDSKRLIGGLTYKYSAKKLESLLQKYIGDIEMNKLKSHVIVPALDLKTNKAIFFSNTKYDKTKTTFLAKDVARMTSAAFTYFKEKVVVNDGVEIVATDGGMSANNPSICAIAKLQKYDNTSLRDICVINIGSGAIKPDLGNCKKWWLGKVATKLPLILLYQGISITQYQLKNLNLGKLFLFDVPENYRDYSEDMADASNINMMKMRNAAWKTIAKESTQIKELVNFLIENKK